jgi:hypothetical protein
MTGSRKNSVEQFVRGSAAQIADIAVRLEAAFNANDAVALASLKYVLLLKHSAGHWKIQYDIWSLDQPSG